MLDLYLLSNGFLGLTGLLVFDEAESDSFILFLEVQRSDDSILAEFSPHVIVLDLASKVDTDLLMLEM